MLPAVLLFLATACEIEMENTSNKKVAVMFSATTGDEEGDDIVLRSVATGEPHTQVVSIGNDLYLYATLTPDPSDASGQLRVAVPPAEGQKICLSAYSQGTTTCVSSVMYTYIGGKLVADDDELLAVEPGIYNFTAYSYYNNTTESPGTSDINPAKDLVWGQQDNRTITSDDRTVTIKMNHLFSQVRVKVRSAVTGITIDALGDATIESSAADLSVHDGALSKGAAIVHPVTFPTFVSTINIDGYETYPVYPGVRVKIESIMLTLDGVQDPVVLKDISLGYNNLAGGKRYVLEVNVKRTRWARSNIYWDGERLTFDVMDEGHQGYQGVHLKWGSLVGISPYGATYRNTVPVYVPTYVESGSSTWSAPSSSPAWNDIPYLDESYDTDGSDNDTYVIAAGRNTPEIWASGRGDICQYLGETQPALSGYRLPIATEFQVVEAQEWNMATPTSGGWIKGDGDFSVETRETHLTTAGYADGRADMFATQSGTGYNPDFPSNRKGIKFGVAINQEMGVMLPYTLVRNMNGAMNARSYYPANYWGASLDYSRNENAAVMLFIDLHVQESTAARKTACSVRCIRKEVGE
jgi:hypothetical protein